MGILNQIIEGHFNEFKSLIGATSEEANKVFNSRKAICDSCPLKNGNTCNPALSIHPLTLKTAPTSENRIGFVRGCGCRLSAKQKASNTKCPAGFWGGEFNR